MKIGLVCPYDMFKGGGVQEVTLALHHGLLNRGHDSRIITPVPPSYDGSQNNDIIFIGASRDIKSPFKTTAQISINLNTDDITETLNKEKFDILHFHEPWIPIMSRQLLSRSSAVNVATFHAKLPETIVSKAIERVIVPYTKSIMKYLDYLSAVSDAAADYVQSLTDKKIQIIPNGIDLTKYRIDKKKNTVDNHKKTILYIGRLEKRKGVKYLLKAFALFAHQHKDVQLIIAGDGPDKLKLEEYAKNYEIPNVKFLGHITESKKLALLNEADLFCSPALYGESFGIVLLEAMATGIPIVAGDNPGYRSVLTGAGASSLVDTQTTPAFAAQLQRLLFDVQLRKEWLEWAEKNIRQYDYESVVSQYETLYLNALKDSK